MAAQHLTRREFEDWRDNLTGFFETTVDRAVRSSERRIMAEFKAGMQKQHEAFHTEMQKQREAFHAEMQKQREAFHVAMQEQREAFHAEMQDAREEFRAEIKWLKDQNLDHRERITNLEVRAERIENTLNVILEMVQRINDNQQKR